MELSPDLAVALSTVAPFMVSLMVKAQASQRTRALVSVGLVACLVAGTYLGDSHPVAAAELAALVGQMVAVTIGAYKLVDTLMGDNLHLNEILLPEQGLG